MKFHNSPYAISDQGHAGVSMQDCERDVIAANKLTLMFQKMLVFRKLLETRSTAVMNFEKTYF